MPARPPKHTINHLSRPSAWRGTWRILLLVMVLGAGVPKALAQIPTQVTVTIFSDTYPLSKADHEKVSFLQQLTDITRLLAGGRNKAWKLDKRLIGLTDQVLYDCETDDTLLFRTNNVIRISGGTKRCSLLDPDNERGYWQYMPGSQRLIISNDYDLFIYDLVKLTPKMLKIRYTPEAYPDEPPPQPITLIFKPY